MTLPDADWALDALEGLPSGVLITDAQGTIRYSNPSAQRILGASFEHLRNRPLTDVLGSVQSLVAAQRPTEGRGELQISNRDGDRILLGYGIHCFEHEGDEHYVCLLRNLEWLHATERERDRLLQLATLSEILPSLMHEVRNPLASVSATLEVMIEDEGWTVTKDELKALLGEVHRVSLGLRGVQDMTRDLRSSVPHPVSEAIQDAVQLLRKVAATRTVEVDVTLDIPELPFEPAVIRAMVFHLVSNGIAATEPGGRVRVLAGMTGRREFALDVVDEGAGMTDEQLRRCTELFFTTKRQGSGLGLSLCRHVVEKAGGRLDIDSQLHFGTRIGVRLPV